jgi:hypothetical protein
MALCCRRPRVRVHTPRTRLLDLSEVDACLVIMNQACAWMKDASPAKMTGRCGGSTRVAAASTA